MMMMMMMMRRFIKRVLNSPQRRCQSIKQVADKQRLEASIRRAVWLGLYTANDPTLSQLTADMDDNLFTNILNNPHHVLHKLLPGKTGHTYNLRTRRDSFSLTVKTECNNFINRNDIY